MSSIALTGAERWLLTEAVNLGDPDLDVFPVVEFIIRVRVAETRAQIADELARLVRTPPGVTLSETTRTYMHAHSIVMQEGKQLSDMPQVMGE